MGYLNLHLVPTDPNFVPNKEGIEIAVRLCEGWWDNIDYVFEGPPHVTISANQELHGSFPERIVCPQCKRQLEISVDEDLDEWQYEAKTKFYSSKNQKAVAFKMPCCAAEVAATDLNLDAPTETIWSTAHYSRFAIELSDFSSESLSPEHFSALEQALGCRLIQFLEGGT